MATADVLPPSDVLNGVSKSAHSFLTPIKSQDSGVDVNPTPEKKPKRKEVFVLNSTSFIDLQMYVQAALRLPSSTEMFMNTYPESAFKDYFSSDKMLYGATGYIANFAEDAERYTADLVEALQVLITPGVTMDQPEAIHAKSTARSVLRKLGRYAKETNEECHSTVLRLQGFETQTRVDKNELSKLSARLEKVMPSENERNSTLKRILDEAKAMVSAAREAVAKEKEKFLDSRTKKWYHFIPIIGAIILIVDIVRSNGFLKTMRSLEKNYADARKNAKNEEVQLMQAYHQVDHLVDAFGDIESTIKDAIDAVNEMKTAFANLETDFSMIQRRLQDVDGDIDEDFMEDRVVALDDLRNAEEVWSRVYVLSKQFQDNGILMPSEEGEKEGYARVKDEPDAMGAKVMAGSSQSDPESPQENDDPPIQNTSSATAWRSRVATAIRNFVSTNKGVVLVTLAQFFGSMMNMTARILEHEAKLHPLQVLFARMSLTIIISYIYMWWNATPDFPLGHPSVRRLLVFRGFFGFLGIYGIWTSLMYLDLGEATVLTFLTPSVAGYACHILLHERFTMTEQLASFVAFGGVVVIAKPGSLFRSPELGGGSGDNGVNGTMVSSLEFASMEEEEVTPLQRLFAIGMGMVGVVGASGAYTLIRWIGKRAHPLISVSYFSGTSTAVSAVVLSLAPVLDINQPALKFDMPHGTKQWGMLLFLGTCGFIMQFLLTSGLRMDKTNKATMAMYTQMVFAVGFDRWVFGTVMDWTTVIGCTLIIGSAIWVTLAKGKPETDEKKKATEQEPADPEHAGLLEGQSAEESDYGTLHSPPK
ncbi:hypothetical protein MKZ38_009170 [Zalerion maritima]|uniref:EamA domain-containing protein n=1 Tax=Zalerion maritima TaxID=339359 RepID=A0AAD5WTM1_9PEZI|nr:hypothetical protein MKZ38_009170 [Zalerion maritima]